ncbi:MAG: mechanosensitive ion channel [Saprospiraceae bacterium]|nr:mechanosensitive ion channel [Saprospiraceae bacterium]
MNELRNLDSAGVLLPFVQFIIWTLFILFLTWLLQKLISRTITENMIRYRTKKAVRLFSYFLIIILAIVSFTGKLQYLTITIGLITAGIAFALQEIVLSVAGWIAIFSSSIYKPGDRIEINNIKGDVIDIGITKTTLMEIGDWVSSDNYNGRIVQVSNAFVFKSAVRNYSTDFPFVWDEINIPIKYGSDVKLAYQIMNDVAKKSLTEYARFAKVEWQKMISKYLIEAANVEPTIAMTLNDNWIEYNIRYVVDYKRRRLAKHDLFVDLYEAIDQTKGKVTLASATFELTGIPEIDVRLSK